MVKTKKSSKKKESAKKIERKNKKTKIKKERDWEEIIPEDQLSGSKYTGVESGEIKESTEREIKKGAELAKKVLPSLKGAAQHDSAWENPDLSLTKDLDTDEDISDSMESVPDLPRAGLRTPEILATPGQYIEVDFESFDKNKRILRGKIIEMYSDRAVPEIDETVVGTPENPALLIEIYEELEDGKWRPTGKLIGLKMNEIQRRVQVFNER